jgi:transcriptional regulator with XRE-family HTH domain
MSETIGQEFARRVSVLRKSHGMTLDDLAERTGVSRSMLSQIERGLANPTLAVAARIAGGFGLSIAHLVEGGSKGALVEVVPHDDEQAIFADKNGCRVRTLSPLRMEKDIELYELRFAKGGSLESEPHFAGTREILTIASGRIGLLVGQEPVSLLQEGDTAHYPADRQHKIANAGDGDATCYLVVTYP